MKEIFGINGSICVPEQKSSINFSKANLKFGLSLHCNADNSYLFVDGKKSSSLNFVSEVYLKDSAILSLEKYL